MISRRTLGRSVLGGFLISLLPQKALSQPNAVTRVIYEDLEWGGVREFVSERPCMVLTKRRGRYGGIELSWKKVFLRGFEVAAYPTWKQNPVGDDRYRRMSLRSRKMADKAIDAEVLLNIDILKSEFMHRFERQPCEIRVAQTTTKEIALDDAPTRRNGLLVFREVGMIAF